MSLKNLQIRFWGAIEQKAIEQLGLLQGVDPKSQRFWRNRIDDAHARIRDLQGSSLKCPNCLRWTYEMKTPPNYFNEVETSEFQMLCMSCGFKSQWMNTGFMGVCVMIGESPAKNRGIVAEDL